MPRNVDNVWFDIPNITAVPGDVIQSADWNDYRADLRDNEFNAARPITAGGTGATNVEDALTNLGISDIGGTSPAQLDDMYFLAMTS